MALSRPCIVVFGARVGPDGRPGRILGQRIAAALEAWRTLPDARLLLTGGRIGRRRAEALVMQEELMAAGVPRSALMLEPESKDTFQSAIACAALLRRLADRGELLVCSSDFHLPRCRTLMALQGFSSRGVAARSSPRPLLDARFLYRVMRESVALPYDALLMLWYRLRHSDRAPPG